MQTGLEGKLQKKALLCVRCHPYDMQLWSMVVSGYVKLECSTSQGHHPSNLRLMRGWGWQLGRASDHGTKTATQRSSLRRQAMNYGNRIQAVAKYGCSHLWMRGCYFCAALDCGMAGFMITGYSQVQESCHQRQEMRMKTRLQQPNRAPDDPSFAVEQPPVQA